MKEMETRERARDLVKRLREKPSKYNRDLLDAAADTIEALLAGREGLKEATTCN